jgi:hypothetical protein
MHRAIFHGFDQLFPLWEQVQHIIHRKTRTNEAEESKSISTRKVKERKETVKKAMSVQNQSEQQLIRKGILDVDRTDKEESENSAE